MSIQFRLTLLISLLFLAAIANSFFIIKLEKVGDNQSVLIDQTNEILISAEKLLSALKDAETGQRGYLLTSDLLYLDPYYRGIDSFKEHLTRLKQMTIDDLEQQELLNKIEIEATKKIEELSSTITKVQEGRINEAINIVTNNSGKRYMDDIRSNVNKFTRKELISLENRKGDFRETRAIINTIMIGTIVFFLLLSVVTILFLNKALFRPLKQLTSGAEKVEKGQKLDTFDIVRNDEMGLLLATFFNMSERVFKRSMQLTYKATHDELTGLKNRETLQECIDKSLQKTLVNKHKLAILFIDLNDFKEINDAMSHEAGDLLLRETAKRLNSSVRSNDEIFRVGGDEFLVVLNDLHSDGDAETITQKIVAAFCEPTYILGKQMTIKLSIGIALSPTHTSSINQLVKYADIAMYAAKRSKTTDYMLFHEDMLKREEDKTAS